MYPVEWLILILCIMISVRVNCSEVVNVRGAGATFPSVVYKTWISHYKAARQRFVSLNMTYEAIGSGAGKARITSTSGSGHSPVEYAGTDSLLSEQDYEKYPDLQLIPTMAGAVVVAYNLPGVTSLNLTRDHVLGIYNGTYTWWNDSSFHTINPSAALPTQKIIVIVRADKSGTTELFTSALSAFSSSWRNSYGVFSEGLNEKYEPYHWDPDVISFYGLTTNGVTGLVMSVRYSLTYLSKATAKDYGVKQANIVNLYGNIVGSDAASVENAMNDFSENFTSRLTSSLVDGNGEYSYPIAGYTYIIVHMSTMLDCNSAIEIYRYIEWFMTDDQARKNTIQLEMVPLSEKVQHKVFNMLKYMECRGLNVLKLVENQKRQEAENLQTWSLALFIIAPVMTIILVLLLVYIIWQYLKINKILIKGLWKIDASHIQPIGYSRGNHSTRSITSNFSITDTQSDSESIYKRQLHLNSVKVARWNGRSVCLRSSSPLNINSMKTSSKKAFIYMYSQLNHVNVARLYGMTELDNASYFVSEFCSKGILEDILYAEKYKLDDNFKFSISLDIALGMEYLHKHELIHGRLNSCCCHIDAKWNVKILDYEFHSLTEQQGCLKYFSKNRVKPKDDEFAIDDMSTEKNPRWKLWIAPEQLQNPCPSASKCSDSYSFGILVHEIFTQSLPFDQPNGELDIDHVLRGLISNTISPKLSDEAPQSLSVLLRMCWSYTPHDRPRFSKITEMLKASNPMKKSVLDSMMEALEQYVDNLEEKVNERTNELKKTMESLEQLLHQMLPPSVARKLSLGQTVEPEAFQSVSVYFSDIVGFTNISAVSTPLEIVEFLNTLYTVFDAILERHDVYKVETIGDAYMVISGLPRGNGIHHAGHIATMSLDIACAAHRFTISHMPNQRLNIRIGIHSGPVVAGVVGIKMPRYCLFGDTVNTASRMESSSLSMKIQISEDTAALLWELGGYHLQHRGKIAIKGKGLLDTYWLHNMDGYPQPIPEEFTRHVTKLEGEHAQ